MLTVCRHDFGTHLFLGRNDARGLLVNVKQGHILAWLNDPLTAYEIIPHLGMHGIYYTLGNSPASAVFPTALPETEAPSCERPPEISPN
jgi:hypothetical protein